MMRSRKRVHRSIAVIICLIAVLFAVFFKSAPVFLFYQGKNYFKNKNFIKARISFKKAFFFNKTNKDLRYYYVHTLINLKPDYEVQKELFAIANDEQQDSAQQLALNKINEWRNYILYYAGDNYIEQVPFENGIVRWDTKKFPLRINISNLSKSWLPEYYRTEILRAFSQWQASCPFLKFVVVDNNVDSDIQINISSLPKNICENNVCKYVVGFTDPTIKGSYLAKMTITLYSTDPKGNYFSDKELYNTILHEIGHALGIMGHSYSSEDLMYMSTDSTDSFYAPYRSSFQYLSSKDINTLTLLYKMMPQYTNSKITEINSKGLIYPPIILGTNTQISLRKLKEAQIYIKKAPELPGGYIDMAVAYAELNKPGDAVKSLNKALKYSKSAQEKYIVFYNLAVVAMNNGNMKNALKYAQQAKEYYTSDEIDELIMNINHAIKSKSKPFKNNLIN